MKSVPCLSPTLLRVFRATAPLPLAAALLPLAGCHSRFIETTVQNASGGPVRLLEVDYPSASFGVEVLEPNAVFHYRFKVIGQGAVKLDWTDKAGQEHTASGPSLQEGQEGQLSIVLTGGQPLWRKNLR